LLPPGGIEELLFVDDGGTLSAEQSGAVVVQQPDHPALGGADDDWPILLGHNRVVARPDSTVLVTLGGDPLVAVAQVGAGRSAVFTSDCSPHWAPETFCEQWPGYAQIFGGLIEWLAQ
jgi:uncharacterized membrane protein